MILEAQILGWTCDAMLEIGWAVRAADEHAILTARPRSLLESYAEARVRMAEVGAWRRALEASATD